MAHHKTTTTPSAAVVDMDELELLPRSTHKGKIKYRHRYTAMPVRGAQLCLEKDITPQAMRLWLAIVLAANGAPVVTVTNSKLMTASGLGKNDLNPKRKELKKAGILAFTAADKRRVSYTYDLEPPKRSRETKVTYKQQSTSGDPRTAMHIEAQRLGYGWRGFKGEIPR
jgi:hypothetical protein